MAAWTAPAAAGAAAAAVRTEARAHAVSSVTLHSDQFAGTDGRRFCRSGSGGGVIAAVGGGGRASGAAGEAGRGGGGDGDGGGSTRAGAGTASGLDASQPMICVSGDESDHELIPRRKHKQEV